MGGYILQFAAMAVVIIVAGALLTRFADKIAEETGLGRVLIGTVVLAAATSMPELMTDINAALVRRPDIAAGDLVGSSLMNLLILAVLDTAFRPVPRTFTAAYARHAPTVALSVLLTAVVGLAIISRLQIAIWHISFFTIVIALFYLVGLRLTYQMNQGQGVLPLSMQMLREGLGRKALARAMAGFALCTLAILAAAPYLVEAADQVALLSGLGHTFIGTTAVALTTSLPELVTTLQAFRMRAPDLAMGNIFGSNTFNMVIFIPVDVAFHAPILGAVSPLHAVTALAVILVSAVIMLRLVTGRPDGKAAWWQPGGGVIVALLAGALYLIYYLK